MSNMFYSLNPQRVKEHFFFLVPSDLLLSEMSGSLHDCVLEEESERQGGVRAFTVFISLAQCLYPLMHFDLQSCLTRL